MDFKAAALGLFSAPSRFFAVVLWDGTRLEPARDLARGSALVLKQPEAVRAFLPPITEGALAEAYAAETLDIEGDAIALLEAASRWHGPELAWTLRLFPQALHKLAERSTASALRAHPTGTRHTRERDRQAIRHHYDHNEEFYALFLDETLTYSCAYFVSGEESLDDAQRNKRELICRKLDLQPGERFLDVGCGFGGLLSHAGSTRGVRGYGITLSAEQFRGCERRRGDRLPRDVDVRLCDYRKLEARGFHKIASIGMMEHVGAARIDEYFESMFRVLEQGGLFLNQAIAGIESTSRALAWTAKKRARFIEQYIFPDAELLPLEQVLDAAARAGFEVRDVECLREHYARTLEAWLTRLDARFADALRMLGRARARLWRLYLAASAAAFRRGKISIFQVLLAKPELASLRRPVSRSNWYEGLAAAAGS